MRGAEAGEELAKSTSEGNHGSTCDLRERLGCGTQCWGAGFLQTGLNTTEQSPSGWTDRMLNQRDGQTVYNEGSQERQ